MLLFLLVVVIVSLVGGFYPALRRGDRRPACCSTTTSSRPIHTFTITEPENVLALVVFVVIAALVSRVVDVAARRSSRGRPLQRRGRNAVDPGRQPAARRAGAARAAATGPGDLRRHQRQRCCAASSEAPASTAAGRRDSTAAGLRGTWTCVASVGDDPCLRPEDGDTEVPVGDDLLLVLRGRTLAAEDQRVLAAFATQVAVAYQQRRLAEAAAAAIPLAETDRMRTALLNAVSHDLRTPIASAKAAVSEPAQQGRRLDRAGSRRTARQRRRRPRPADRLVTNLLDLSRLQAGVLTVGRDAGRL